MSYAKFGAYVSGEDNFLHSVISDVTEGMCQFKLAPCYSLYLAARYRVDRVKPGMSMDEHLHKLSAFCNKVQDSIHPTVMTSLVSRSSVTVFEIGRASCRERV